MFPILQMFPNAMVIRGTKLNQDLRKTYGGFVKDVERKLQNGEQVQDCLAKMMIQSSNKEHLTELDVDMMAAAFMIGGVETVCLHESLL
jgi:cytochrome P450